MLQNRNKRHRLVRLNLPVFLCVWLALFLIVIPTFQSTIIYEQVNPTVVVPISPGSTLRRNLASKEAFEITLDNNQLLRLTLEKRDLCLSLSIFDPYGKEVWRQRSDDFERLEIALPTTQSGKYRLEIQSNELADTPDEYQLTVHRVVAVRDIDRQQFELRQVMSSVDYVGPRWTAAALRNSVDVYEQAYRKWLSFDSLNDASQVQLKIGDAWFQLSDYAKALESYTLSATLAGKTQAHASEATALSRAGRVCSYIGDNRAAQSHVLRALKLIKDEAKSDDYTRHALGEVLSSLGEVSYAVGDFEKASRQFERAGMLLNGDRRRRGNVHLFSAYIAGGRGEPDKANSEIDTALTLYRSIADRRGEALSLTALGLVSALKRDENRAIELHQQAIHILETIGDHHSEAIARNGLAQSYENLIDYPNALDHYQKALKLFEEIGAVDLMAVTTFHVARAQKLNGKLDQSLETYQKSLDLSRAGGKARTEANARSEIAAILSTQGKAFQSLRENEKLLRFYGSIKDRYSQALTLNALGDSQLKLGRRKQAFARYKRALELGERSGDRGILLSTLFRLSRAHRDINSNELALSLIERSFGIIEDLRTNLTRTDFRASYFSDASKHYELGIDILMRLDHARPDGDFAAKALMMSERSRARSLVDLISQSKAPAVKSFPLATLDQIRKQLLDHDTMLLEYALGEERSYLWTVTADSFQSYELRGREEVETAAREFYELTTSRQSELGDDYPTRIAHSENVYSEKAQKLSRILLGPVAEHLGSRRLLVVAEGALQYLPFEALPVRATQTLIETNEIVRLPSISTLVAIRSRTRTEQSASKVAALIADPVFSRNDDRISGEFLTASAAHAPRSSSIKISRVPARLSYAATEVKAITQAAPTGTTLLASGFDASRAT
jgi:tetratricopeptide (TPR) repeat protein